jgi:leucine dehydrogenase
MGILYAPDYIVNAGGLIAVADEFNGFNKDRAFKNASLIYDTVTQIFKASKEQNLPTHTVADLYVEEKVEKIGRLQTKYTGK